MLMDELMLLERGSPELFRGGRTPDVLFLGQDPTIVSRRHISHVLDLSNSRGHLHKYVFGNICRRLSIPKRRIMAWNLVNRYFVDKPRTLAHNCVNQDRLREAFPEVNGRKGDWDTVRFLYSYFRELGKPELEYVVDKYSPRVLISLGEPVFRVLRHAYASPQGLSVPENLADFCCEEVHQLRVAGVTLLWLSLPHEPTGDHNPHYMRVLEEKLPSLRSIMATDLPK